MVPFGWRIVINAVGLWIVDGLWDSMRLVPEHESVLGQIASYLVIGLVLAVVNTVVKPLAKLLSLPLYILTLGLFALIVNAAMLELVSWVTSLTSFGLEIDSFGTAIGAGLVLALVTAILSIPVKRQAADRDQPARRDQSTRWN
ncbi:MAG: phage holin family protein [Bifidobacteriaceae bacterium]|jgi:putative membrane protein|nr:phage holin family protein [Bifidobacteriaceae bacterium]